MEENTEEMNLSKTGSAGCYEEIVRMRALGVGHLASAAVAFVQDEDSSSGTDEGPEHTAMALGITTLEKLYSAITQGDTPLHSGRESHPITPTLFTNILKEENDIWPARAQRLFDMIDWPSLHELTWSGFCAYLQEEYNIKERHEQRHKEVEFVTPALLAAVPHRDPGVRVHRMADGLWITSSEEGVVSLWNNDLELIRHRLCLSKQRLKMKSQKQWVTDSALMPEFNKIILSTGDREIQFFDMASFSPFCQLSGLESIPLCIHYRALSRDKCLVTYGDKHGCVSVITFRCMGASFRQWKKLHNPSMPLDQAVQDKHVTFMRWQVHKDWVNMLRYYPETDQIVSCSKDPNASLVLANRHGSANVAKMRKEEHPPKRLTQGQYSCTRAHYPQEQIVMCQLNGVGIFDFSPKLRMVATGGTDHVIRLWNCFLNKKPVARLSGHYDIIQFLHLCCNKLILFSISKDLWVKVWHVMDHTCLLTVPRHLHTITGELRSANFNIVNKSLALFCDQLGILKIKTDDSVMATSHLQPVTCVVYNPNFNHVISACEASTVKTWNLANGRIEGEFREAHGPQGIADMTLDSTCKRLFTVGKDGTGKMWNYHTGMFVRSLQPEGNNVPITTVVYVDMYKVRYIVTGGWGRHVNLYIDDSPEQLPFVMPLLPRWWDDANKKGHKRDILCSDFSGRDKLATGGFDGVVLVWSIETGHRSLRIVPPAPLTWSEARLGSDRGVSCVHFLRLRSKLRKGGNLVVGGPYGHISIWNTNFATHGTESAVALASFPVNPENNSEDDIVGVCTMDSDSDNTTLVTGDSSGRVTIWDIFMYAKTGREAYAPTRMQYWTAHMVSVTGVRIVGANRFVVTCAGDRTVRLWNLRGHFVGTFGQSTMWNLEDEATFKYPEKPQDIMEFLDAERLARLADARASAVTPGRRKVADAELGRSKRYDIGLQYFARKKAVISKSKSHLNDETHNPYSSSGNVVPYQSLRFHTLDIDPAMPDRTEIDDHLVKADNLHLPD